MKNIENQQLALQSGEVVLYNPDDTIRLEVRMNEETVWLSQTQMVELFQSSKANISEHIKSIYQQHELDKDSTVRFFRTVQKEGNRMVQRNVEFYNLDMIISVGYRVNTKRGIYFRKWATEVLKNFMLRGYVVDKRIENLEQQLRYHDNKIEQLEEQVKFAIQSNALPKEGIFFEGQIFDAYELACRLIKSAKRRMVLIDNYIDESTLLMLEKRNKDVTATIYTHSIGEQLKLDIDRHNAQYRPITVLRLKKSHDRFLILDDDVYHVGASLKDLGKQWFAIMKMNEIRAEDILERIS